MSGAKPIKNEEPLSPYATDGDFCRIFKADMNRLYLLAFLLTADRSLAEKCFVRGLEDSGKGNPVFKEWAQSWARRVIIQKAIQMILTQLTADGASRPMSTGYAESEPAEIATVLALPTFDRFAFVMSALERYSDQECSLLLGCTRVAVSAARIRALRQIGRSADLQSKVLTIGSNQQPLRDDPGSTLKLDALSPLATSA